MKIQVTNPSSRNFTKSVNLSFAKSIQKASNKYQSDVFVKQDSSIHFEGLRKNDKKTNATKENNLGSSLKNLSIKGLPFLLGVVTSVAMVKMGEDAKELLVDNDGYIATNSSVRSDLVNIDTAKGIIKFEGTGIEIDSRNYDIADIENGIFKNYDGTVDIDLSANKFIDLKQGIIIDPENKISGVLDNGRMQSIAVPSFGSGYPTTPWDDRWLTMPNPEGIEAKDPFEKAADFLKGLFKKDTVTTTSDTRDIFGNEIMIAKDDDGDVYLAQFLKHLDDNPIFADFKQKVGAENAVETVNGLRMQNYIEKNHPNFGTRVLVYEGGRGQSHFGIEDYQALERKIQIEQLKNLADKNRDGKLSKDEIKEFLRSLDKDEDGKTTFKELLQHMDINQDNKTSLREFLDFLDLDRDGKTTFVEIARTLISLFTGANED